MELNRYILKVYFGDGNGISYDTIPVIEKSKERVKEIINENLKTSDSFDYWNYTFYKDDVKNHGYQLFTIDEFFATLYGE